MSEMRQVQSPMEDAFYTIAIQTVLFQYKDQLHSVLTSSDAHLVKAMANDICSTANHLKTITDRVIK